MLRKGILIWLLKMWNQTPQISEVLGAGSTGIDACCIVLRSGATRSTSWRVLRPPSDFASPLVPFQPSEELARQVWPQIDGWLRQFDEGTNILEVSFYNIRSYSGVDSSVTQSGAILPLRRRSTPSSLNGS